MRYALGQVSCECKASKRLQGWSYCRLILSKSIVQTAVPSTIALLGLKYPSAQAGQRDLFFLILNFAVKYRSVNSMHCWVSCHRQIRMLSTYAVIGCAFVPNLVPNSSHRRSRVAAKVFQGTFISSHLSYKSTATIWESCRSIWM